MWRGSRAPLWAASAPALLSRIHSESAGSRATSPTPPSMPLKLCWRPCSQSRTSGSGHVSLPELYSEQFTEPTTSFPHPCSCDPATRCLGCCRVEGGLLGSPCVASVCHRVCLAVHSACLRGGLGAPLCVVSPCAMECACMCVCSRTATCSFWLLSLGSTIRAQVCAVDLSCCIVCHVALGGRARARVPSQGGAGASYLSCSPSFLPGLRGGVSAS